MRAAVIAIGVVSATAISAAAQVREITGSELVRGFNGLKGQTVKVTDCVIAGVTQMFIRCETPNNDGPSYAIAAAALPPHDLRWALAVCPTSSWNKEDCRGITVIGEVANRTSPQLLGARFDPPRAPPQTRSAY